MNFHLLKVCLTTSYLGSLEANIAKDNLDSNPRSRSHTVCDKLCNQINPSDISVKSTNRKPLILRLPTELLLQIFGLVLSEDLTNLANLARTCRSIYLPAVTVLYNTLSINGLSKSGDWGEQWNNIFKEYEEWDRRFKQFSPRNAELVQRVIINYSFTAQEWKDDQSICRIFSLCRNVRVLILNSPHTNALFSNRSTIPDKIIQVTKALASTNDLFARVTTLRVSSTTFLFRGPNVAALEAFPSLIELSVGYDVDYDPYVASQWHAWLPIIYQDNGIDYKQLVQDIEAISKYCPRLETWRLPFWEPAFVHRAVRKALAGFRALRTLSFLHQWLLDDQTFIGAKRFPLQTVEEFIGFRFHLRETLGVEVVYHESCLRLSVGKVFPFQRRTAELLDYIYEKLDTPYMLQLIISPATSCTMPVQPLDSVIVVDSTKFRLPKRINLKVIGSKPRFIDPLPSYITSLTFEITNGASWQQWLPALFEIVKSPFLRALRLIFHYEAFVEFSLYSTPPEGIFIFCTTFELCRWRRPIAAKAGFEAVQHHHQWSYYGNDRRRRVLFHDENLEIDTSMYRTRSEDYEIPNGEGDLDFMEKYGLEMLDAGTLEKSFIELAMYVAFHLHVQIHNGHSLQ